MPLTTLRHVLEMIRFSHTLFALAVRALRRRLGVVRQADVSMA